MSEDNQMRNRVFSLGLYFHTYYENEVFLFPNRRGLESFWFNCSDLRYESNGLFVLGVEFFLQKNVDFLSSHFWRNFFLYIIRKLLLSWAQIWKDISPVIVFRKVMGV